MSDYEMGLLGGMIGVFVVSLIIIVACYVVGALAYSKALRMMGYPMSWLAWIPFGAYFALADITRDYEGNTTLFGSVKVPTNIFRLWWILMIVVQFVPVLGKIASIAILVICLGTSFIRVYSALEGKTESDVTVLGYLSAFIQLIAVVKFFTYKEAR